MEHRKHDFMQQMLLRTFRTIAPYLPERAWDGVMFGAIVGVAWAAVFGDRDPYAFLLHAGILLAAGLLAITALTCAALQRTHPMRYPTLLQILSGVVMLGTVALMVQLAAAGLSSVIILWVFRIGVAFATTLFLMPLKDILWGLRTS